MSQILPRFVTLGELTPVHTAFVSDNGSHGWWFFAEVGLDGLPEVHAEGLGAPDPVLFSLIGSSSVRRAITEVPTDFQSLDAKPFFKEPLNHGHAFWSEEQQLLWLFLHTEADTQVLAG
ncbi:hypothetical protein [Gallaecimonas xiamenensis]|uniref:Uncharacterized protein n=1 Tax=Gallaecimonas xiamenensis 3-C-1 TaxID=745411 RepID=K2ILH1_9GAMM|nr:hypothetical protein [Gallaecimonas xiamenensis]EKE70991.1 hypothetical protein B3C1_13384 [Gallaecimonas xiamenensis 3-C-1]